MRQSTVLAGVGLSLLEAASIAQHGNARRLIADHADVRGRATGGCKILSVALSALCAVRSCFHALKTVVLEVNEAFG